MADPPAFQQRRLPARLGRYLLVERLGSGGMAEVFRAEQDGPAGFRKIVVVKVMHPHLAEDPRYVQMFQREASVAARLNHPNVVAVLELGAENGVTFIVMEHVDGISLHRVLRAGAEHAGALGGPPPRDLILAAIAEAALGLYAAHTAADHDGTPLRLIHRDISPDNLMISRDGVTKVVDFGIAKSSTLGGDTRTGELKGKIPFMAPEMLRGGDIDHRVDIYALGVTLYSALTGQRPFSGATEVALMNSILNDTPRRARDVEPSVTPELDDLIMRMIAREPKDRPADALAVHTALASSVQRRFDVVMPYLSRLRALLPASTPASREPDSTTPLKKEATSAVTVDPVHVVEVGRRRLPPAAIGALAAGVLLVVATGVFVATARRDAPPASLATPTPATPTTTPTALPPAPAAPMPSPSPALVPTPVEPPAVVEAVTPARAAPVERGDRRDVVVTAPERIRWRNPSGKALGAGNGTFSIKVNIHTIVAWDTETGGRTNIPLSDGPTRIDYAALPTGVLDVRAFPYADVYLGKKKLGTTPFPPVKLVAGEYEIRAVSDGKEQRASVQVEAGRTLKKPFTFE